MTVRHGVDVLLRDATPADVGDLTAIRASAEVYARWGGGDDLAADVTGGIGRDEVEVLAIELDGRVVGAIQWAEEDDPM